MRKLIFILSLLISIAGLSQPTSTNPYLGAPKSLAYVRGFLSTDSGFAMLPKDTLLAPFMVGELRLRPFDTSLYVCLSLVNDQKWSRISGGGGGGGSDGNYYVTNVAFTNNLLSLTRNGIGVISGSWDSTKYHSKGFYDGQYYSSSNPSGFLTNITGKISQGTNITITGSGTSGSPYVINSSGGGAGAGIFPVKVSGTDISLFPKVTQPLSLTGNTPYNPTFEWDTLTTNQLPHWYDGTLAAYIGDTLLKIAGWYSNGVQIWRTDSIYYSVAPYNTWVLWPVRFPIRSHAIAYTYNQARGYWVFCGSDYDGTATENKTVYTTSDFRTFTTRTTNYGGAARQLGSVWADDNGSMYWGFGQTILDSSSHLDDIWKSTDDGVTWSQIATNINVGGFTLGGISTNAAMYRNGFIYLIAPGKYDNDALKRVYTKRTFQASILNPQVWWEIDTIPITNAKQYGTVCIFNGWIFYINGNDGVSNTAAVSFLDLNSKWHNFNTGQLGISHAQGATSFKDNLFLMQGNDNNSAYILKRGRIEWPETYKQINTPGVYIGGNDFSSSLRLNVSPGSETSNTFLELDAPIGFSTYSALIKSDAAFPISILPQSVSNNLTGFNFNNRTGIFAGHSTGTYSNVAFGLYDISGSNNITFIVLSNAHTIIGNNTTTVPTNISPLQVKGMSDSVNATFKTVKSDPNGNYFLDTTTTVGTTTTIQLVNGISASTAGNIAIDTAGGRNRLAHKVDFTWWYEAVTDSVSVLDADVLAYVTAMAAQSYTVTTTEKNALQRIVTYLKTNSLWSNDSAFYPVLGTTAAQHAINLRDPTKYTLSYTGGYTHSSNSFVGNGSTGFANTGIIPANFPDQNAITVAMFTTNSGSGGTDIGVVDGTKQVTMIIELAGSTIDRLGSDAITISQPFTTQVGWYGVTRTSTTDFRYCNNSNGNEFSNSSTNSGNLPNRPIYLNAWNLDGTASTFSARNTKIAAIWATGMTATQWANLNTEIQIFATATGK